MTADGSASVDDDGGVPREHWFVRAFTRVAGAARSRGFRIGFLVLTVVAAGVAVALDYEAFADAARQLGLLSILVALVCTLLNIVFAMASWRAVLADLGSRLGVVSAGRIFLVGQLGKYLPGSVWFLLAQMELAAEVGVPRTRSGSASVINIVLTVTTALVTTLVTLPFAPTFLPSGFWWVLVLLPVLSVVLYPPFLNWGFNFLLRSVRRPPLEHPVSMRGALTALGWSALSWLAVGFQVYVLATAVGAESSIPVLLLCLGGYALAWAIGFLTLVAPAGAGAREAFLLLVLAPVLSPGRALVVVIVSRVLLTCSDLALAGLALLGARLRVHLDGGTATPGGDARPAPPGEQP